MILSKIRAVQEHLDASRDQINIYQQGLYYRVMMDVADITEPRSPYEFIDDAIILKMESFAALLYKIYEL